MHLHTVWLRYIARARTITNIIKPNRLGWKIANSLYMHNRRLKVHATSIVSSCGGSCAERGAGRSMLLLTLYAV